MLSIETIIEVALLACIGYLLVHQCAANAYELATYRVLPAWKLLRVSREFVGVCVRRAQGLPTYSALDSAYEVLGLTAQSAADDLVRETYFRLRAEMNQARWAYPDSQHEAVFSVCWELGIEKRMQAHHDFLRNSLGALSLANAPVAR